MSKTVLRAVVLLRRRSGGFECQTGSLCEDSWGLPEQQWTGGHAVWQLLLIGRSLADLHER